MTTIVEFLAARLNERETVAREAQEDTSDGRADPPRWKWTGSEGVYAGRLAIAVDGYGYMDDTVGNHIALHDPAYVSADIAAKRKILASFQELESRPDLTTDPMLRTWHDTIRQHFVYPLALPFDQHPEFDESWRL